MNKGAETASAVRPDLIRRTGGGWLAVAPKDAIFSIGVTASTDDEALEKFSFVFARWVEILAMKALDVPKEP